MGDQLRERHAKTHPLGGGEHHQDGGHSQDVEERSRHTLHRGRKPSAPAQEPGGGRWRLAAVWVGRSVIFLGVAALTLAVYLQWGTNQLQREAQERLRRELFVSGNVTGSTTGSAPVSSAVTVPPEPAVPVPDAASITPGTPLGVLRIPSIGLDQVLVAGADKSSLRLGPGWDGRTVLPGVAGNAAIAGHRTTYGAPFRHLDALVKGDLIEVVASWGTFTYAVAELRVTAPSDLTPLMAQDKATLTLITCDPPRSSARRLIVQATLVPGGMPVEPAFQEETPSTTPVTPTSQQVLPSVPATAPLSSNAVESVTSVGPEPVQNPLVMVLWFVAAAAVALTAVRLRERRKVSVSLAIRFAGWVLSILLLWQWASYAAQMLPEGW